MANQTSVWEHGAFAVAAGAVTHLGCIVNAVGGVLLPLALAIYLRWRRPGPIDRHRTGLGLFLLTWGLPSALFYLLIHFASPGYAMSYLGAVLLAVASALEALWVRTSPRAQIAVLAGVIAFNAWVFLGGAARSGEESGFGVLTAAELRAHESYWRQLVAYVDREHRPGEVAVLVSPSFTDGLRVAQYLLPDHWQATGLAVKDTWLRDTPPGLKPEYFRYVTPTVALRENRPTVCVARVADQARYFRSLFGDAYGEVSLGSGLRAGTLLPRGWSGVTWKPSSGESPGDYTAPRGRVLP
jgi:hypothetical protein